MNEAIKLAIEKGGYFERILKLAIDEGEYKFNGLPGVSQITQAPLFWQSLGKALGWEELVCSDDGLMHPIPSEICRVGMYVGWIPKWHYMALEYFDLLLTGGNTEAFWKEILKSNENEHTKKESA